MLAPRRYLVSLLVADQQPSAAATSSPQYWPDILKLAAWWGVLPELHQRIDLDLQLDASQRSQLANACRDAFATTARIACSAGNVCQRLQRCGIPYVLFKGLAAICYLYRGPQERSTTDADILVPEQHLTAALAVLKEMNLHPCDGGDLNAYTRAIRNMPGFAGNESLALLGGAPFCSVDLHWRLGPHPATEMQAERIIERGVRRNLLGTEVRVACAADGLVLNAHHALRNRFEPDSMIRDLLDAGRWLDLLQRERKLEEAIEGVGRCRIEPAVYALGVISGRTEMIAALACREGLDLIELFKMQSRSLPFGKDIAHLADPKAMACVVRAALSNWSEYRRYLSEFESHMAGRPEGITRRVFRLSAKMWNLRRDHFRAFRALRTLARAKAAFQELPRR